MAKKFTYLADIFSLLPDSQISAYQKKSTESALELLKKQIHMIWKQGKDKVVTFLNMDVAGVFDSISHQRLIHNFCKRKISQ